MKQRIEIEFVEDAPVEIPALTASAAEGESSGWRRQFWLGVQDFGKD